MDEVAKFVAWLVFFIGGLSASIILTFMWGWGLEPQNWWYVVGGPIVGGMLVATGNSILKS